MAQWVKALAVQVEDLGIDPRKPDFQHICNSSAPMGRWEVEAGQSLDVHRPARLAHTAEKQEPLCQGGR